MRLESKKWLEDIRMSCESILEFANGRTFEEYLTNEMFHTAVERDFIIIG